jgi:type IV pilus assembly protein PilW
MMTTLRPISGVARQRGVTLTELMIALVLGALVVLAATAMVVSSRSTYRSQDENTRLAESARFGLELGNRMVRLAGFTNWGTSNSLPATYQPDPLWAAAPDAFAMNGPNIVGANNAKPGGGAGVNGSDSLIIRYFGSSAPNQVTADGNVLDCAGTAVPDAPTATSGPTAAVASTIGNAARAYNVLYVDYDPTDGEPSLYCKRQTYDPVTGLANPTMDSQILIRGVEDFQVLFGEYIPPLTITPPCVTLDDVGPQNIVYRTGVGGPNAVPANNAITACSPTITSNWGNVRTVRIAMLLRSATGARPDLDPTPTYKLFGASYPTAASDPGVSFDMTALSATEKTRVRRVVETTIFVRNRESGWSSVQFN